MIVPVPDGSRRTVNVQTDDPEYAARRAAEWAAENPIVERGAELGEEDVSALGDIGRAVGAGIVGTAEGYATFPADLGMSDEQSREELEKFFSRYKPEVKTELGKAVKFITQFGLSGGLAAKAAKGLGSLGKVGAFAAADVAATTPDVETLGDFFDGGPTKRITTEDLEGLELASANLSNRFKVAGEGTAILLGVPKALGVVGAGLGAASDVLAKTEMVKRTARAIRSPDSILTDVGVKPDIEDLTFIEKNLAKASKAAGRFFTSKGDMPDSQTKQLEYLRVQQLNAQNNAARQGLEQVDHALKALKSSGNLNEVDERVTLDALNNYLFAEDVGVVGTPGFIPRSNVQEKAANQLLDIDQTIKKANIPSLFAGKRDLSLFQAATKLRGQIDSLSSTIVNDTFMGKSMTEDLTAAFEANKTFYGTRMYRTLKDPEGYSPSNDQAKAALEEVYRVSEQIKPGQVITEQEARGVLNDLRQKVSFNNSNMKPKEQFDESTLSGVAQGILKGRRLDNLPAIRDFLGEYSGGADVLGRVKRSDGTFGESVIRQRSVEEQRTGLKTRAIETIDGMTKSITKSDYYNNLSKYNDSLPEEGRFIFDEIPLDVPIQDMGKYKRIGMEGTLSGSEVSPSAIQRFGPLAGKYVREEYHRAFEDMPAGLLNPDTNRLWATFLGLKGFSQVAKTVLSPITQVRNATTAAFFALRNGNFGNSEDLVGSAETVFSQIGERLIKLPGSNGKRATKKEIDTFYNKMIDLGIVNTNSKVGEFEDLFKDALNAKGGVIGGKVGRNLLQKAQNIQNTFAGKLYQGSDDIWKIYSYEMELGRLKNAFKNSPLDLPVTDVQNSLMLKGRKPSQLVGDEVETFLEREAASIVKDTVPNYARVPEFIKTLRRMPFGNFVAFPAEIIRTSGNTYGRAIKELGSNSGDIRSIGMRRLMGSMTVDAGMYGGLMAGGLALTGSTMEQVDAYKRSFAAPWERNAMLIPMATDKDGKITDFYNFSYTNPYDYLTRPARAIFSAVNNGITNEKDLSDIALDATIESGREFFSPFLGESIMTEKILDLTRNQTEFGRPIFLDGDTLGVKAGKSFAHFADGLMPGISPVDLAADDTSPLPFGATFKLRDLPKAAGYSVGLLDERDLVKRSGQRIDPAGEFLEAITGLKTVKPTVQNSLRYKAYDAKAEANSANKIFNQFAKTRGNASAEDLTKKLLVANEQRFKALRELNTAIEDARLLGLSNRDIIKPLTEAKVPHLRYIMSGRFNAFFPSKETINFAVRGNEDKLKNPFDFAAMAEVTKEFQGKPFRSPVEADAQAAKQLASQPPVQAQPAAPMPPARAGTPPGQPQPGAPTPPTPPQSLFDRGVDALKQVELNKLLGID